MIKLVIADDHQMFIDGLSQLLKAESDFSIADVASNGLELIKTIKKSSPDVVLMDINMPEMNGINASKQIKKQFPKTRILAVSMYKNKEFILGLNKIGIDGYILKNTGKDELLQAIRSVHEGQKYFSKEIAETLLKSFNEKDTYNDDEVPELTRREIEILKLLADGMSAKEIAQQLFLSILTVDTHRKNMLHKTKMKNVPELIKYAAQLGLLD